MRENYDERDQQRQDVLDFLLEHSREAFFSMDTQWRILALNHQASLYCQQPRESIPGTILWDASSALAPCVLSLPLHEASHQHGNLEETTFSSALKVWLTLRLYSTQAGFALFVQEIPESPLIAERSTSSSLAQAILDSMDASIAILDARGTIQATNEIWRQQQREMCVTTEQLERTGVGMNYLDVCRQAQGADAEEVPEVLAGIQAVLQGAQSSFILEYPCFSATRQNWYLMSVTPLPQFEGAVITHIDITQRKRLDEQKDTFIALAGHELRTPLTALKGLVQLKKKQEEKQGREEYRRFLLKVEAHIDHLTRLVGELLDVSKMQAGTFDYSEEVIDLETFLKAVVEAVQQIYPEYRLRFHGISTHAMIVGDQHKLAQVATNLLNNAIIYSPQGSTVDIFLEIVGDTVCIRIQDYGIGIPRKDMDHLFERFYRVRESRRHHTPGLGLGLYIAHEIVSHHRGTISVTSEEGQGSTFSILLPLCKKEIVKNSF